MDFNSDAQTSGATPSSTLVGGLTHAEARAKGLERLNGLLARVWNEKPAYWAKMIAATPPRYLMARLRATFRIASMRAAIKAKCEECVGYEDVVKRVGGCTSHGCPLLAYRPYAAHGSRPAEPSPERPAGGAV